MLALIYMAFVSMGLPDGLLGAGWPSMYPTLQVPISYAGIITILITSSTVVSGFFSDHLIRRFGTGKVTAFCTLLTALALLGFSSATRFWHLCLLAVPYGLGGGSIDAALNNYVATRFKSRHMNFIHFFWGLGAAIGPYIMGTFLTHGQLWQSGYRLVGIVQSVMTVCFFLTLPWWKKNPLPTSRDSGKDVPAPLLTKRQALQLPGAKSILLSFICYCAVENTAGFWAASYMTLSRGINAETAAQWASFFYLGITGGRFLCAFIADRFGDRMMVRAGQIIMLAGALLFLIPLGNALCFSALMLIGLGCAPIFPALLHETPDNFGPENSQTLMGLQMSVAYVGASLMPPFFGVIAQHVSIRLYPVYMLLFMVIMLFSAEHMNRTVAKNKAVR